MTDPPSAGQLVGIRRRERVVRERLWPKVKATLATVPFLDHVLAAYFATLDPRTPWRAKATLLGALAYFIAPIDAIPDALVGLGFTDDFSVLMLALRTASAHILPEHYERARATLAEARAGGSMPKLQMPRGLRWPRVPRPAWPPFARRAKG